jgi:hypothetical protein
MTHRDPPGWVPYFLLFAACLVVGVSLWGAPDAGDAMEAVEREREAGLVLPTATVESLTSVRHEMDRRYSVERRLEDTTEALTACRQALARERVTRMLSWVEMLAPPERAGR